MYYYLYDTFLAQRKYRDTLARFETRVTDLGIQGKIGRLTMLKNVRELMEQGIRKGAKTIVICGNDDTIFRALAMIVDARVTLGIVPFGGANTVAAALGIPDDAEKAAEALSERRLVRLDLGLVNETTYFLRDCIASLPAVSLECNQQYQVTPLGRTIELQVANLPSGTVETAHANPTDGHLDTTIAHRNFFSRLSRAQMSYIPTTHLTVPLAQPKPLILDGWNTVMTPVTIEVFPEALRVIVGKQRTF